MSLPQKNDAVPDATGQKKFQTVITQTLLPVWRSKTQDPLQPSGCEALPRSSEYDLA